MPSLPIRQFGDPVLKQRAKDVEDVDGTLARTVDAMYDTMYEAEGGGHSRRGRGPTPVCWLR